MPNPAHRQQPQVAWDGRRMQVQSDVSACYELRINGSRFIDLHANPGHEWVLEFPFSPTGQAHFNIDLLTDGSPPGQPNLTFSVALGMDGILPAMASPIALAPQHDAARLLPLDAQPMQREIVIVIPVYNAADAVQRCLESVLEHSSGRFRLIVINDASTDPAIAPLLESYRSLDGIELLENPENLGFTATVNRGMQAAGRADVVLLNADTEVSANWLTGLRHALHSAPDVATATAVSNNAGAFSVPELEQENPFPTGWNLTRTARSVWQEAGLAYPELPTGNGFCMLIRREVLDAVGLFDVAAFPHGYGEENDFCQRASAHGWRHLIAGNVYVAHARSLSFGSERRELLGRAGMQVLRERWPNYETDVGRTLFSFERRVLDWRVRCAQSHSRVCVPLPRQLGLTPPDALDADFESWMLAMQSGCIRLVTGDGRIRESMDTTRFDDLHCAHWLQLHAIERVRLPRSADCPLARLLATQANRLGIAVSIEGRNP